eukprot:TRINITY_DN1969_c0_g1_i1.p1 TRINITY_DN1969_c0_g1~~TRINITY_DN1969_c0_g1_i1.p1  ORF type:complete len:335 (-),score=69.40 TRINITY_DN1969_c0_g1_i1:14-1018(-)
MEPGKSLETKISKCSDEALRAITSSCAEEATRQERIDSFCETVLRRGVSELVTGPDALMGENATLFLQLTSHSVDSLTAVLAEVGVPFLKRMDSDAFGHLAVALDLKPSDELDFACQALEQIYINGLDSTLTAAEADVRKLLAKDLGSDRSEVEDIIDCIFPPPKPPVPSPGQVEHEDPDPPHESAKAKEKEERGKHQEKLKEKERKEKEKKEKAREKERKEKEKQKERQKKRSDSSSDEDRKKRGSKEKPPKFYTRDEQYEHIRKTRPPLAAGITLDQLQNNYWVDELKAFCREKELKATGKKTELIKRVFAHFRESSTTSEPKAKRRRQDTP